MNQEIREEVRKALTGYVDFFEEELQAADRTLYDICVKHKPNIENLDRNAMKEFAEAFVYKSRISEHLNEVKQALKEFENGGVADGSCPKD